MKVFLENYNGVLDLVEDELKENGELTSNPHEADVFLLWQDVRGVHKELARIAKEMGKPVVVMQHGRGATRDYLPPNNFKPSADLFLVWGQSEKDRLLKAGVPEAKISIVGCPMFERLLPPVQRQGRNILFVPVIAQKEEPENLLVYAALKKWESEQLSKTVLENFEKMKSAWAWENNEMREVVLPDGSKEHRLWKREVKTNLPRWVTYGAGLVNVKLSGVHDSVQYQSPQIVSGQNDPFLIDGICELLRSIDVMVCLEEGTMQLMAHAMGIPVIVVDIFQYRNYGGCENYDQVEKIKTDACYWVNSADKVGAAVDHAFKHGAEKKFQRLQVCKHEGAWGEISSANVLNAVRSIVSVAA